MSFFDEGRLGIRWRLRAMRRLWRPGAHPQMMFLPPVPIPAETDGKLDHPGAGFEFEEGLIGFGGWVAFSSGQPVARVEGWLDDTLLGRARTNLPRPDVESHKDLPLARLSGFEYLDEVGSLPTKDQAGERALRVIATAVDGEGFEFDPIPIKIGRQSHSPPEAAGPAPIAFGPRGPGGIRAIVFTHQLTLGGAQLYLLDLLRGLREQGGIEFTVVSAVDGPVRDDLKEMGIPVHLTSIAAMEKVGSHLGRVEELAAWAAPGEFDVAIVNTATSAAFFGAEVATGLSIPTVWAIHESFPPALLWADLEEEVRGRAEMIVGGASCAIFEADATRRIFEPLIDPDRCRTLPYGVDFSSIERARADFDGAQVRREASIPDEAEVILCVGTVEPRKAQIPLAQAFGLVARNHPNARLVFVGARKEDRHSEDLEECIAASPVGHRIDLIPITPDVQPWYGVADLLVCASDVESLPRTVLEAMAWETPVLATSVFGLPELIEDGETGWLCETRDTRALADGLDRFLRSGADERLAVARRARSLVETRHSLPAYAEQVMQILKAAQAEAAPTPTRKDDSNQ